MSAAVETQTVPGVSNWVSGKIAARQKQVTDVDSFSCAVKFESIKHHLSGKLLRRPARNQPIAESEPLERELSAWDAASDEIWESLNDDGESDS